MSILSTLIDRSTYVYSGNTGGIAASAFYTTQAHSLPATNPDIVLLSLQSIQLSGVSQFPVPVQAGGNASLSTVGVLTASSASVGVLAVQVLAVVWHSIQR